MRLPDADGFFAPDEDEPPDSNPPDDDECAPVDMWPPDDDMGLPDAEGFLAPPDDEEPPDSNPPEDDECIEPWLAPAEGLPDGVWATASVMQPAAMPTAVRPESVEFLKDMGISECLRYGRLSRESGTVCKITP
jgi:hypothetical protein